MLWGRGLGKGLPAWYLFWNFRTLTRGGNGCIQGLVWRGLLTLTSFCLSHASSNWVPGPGPLAYSPRLLGGGSSKLSQRGLGQPASRR